jgi:hypothetical protein
MAYLPIQLRLDVDSASATVVISASHSYCNRNAALVVAHRIAAAFLGATPEIRGFSAPHVELGKTDYEARVKVEGDEGSGAEIARLLHIAAVETLKPSR